MTDPIKKLNDFFCRVYVEDTDCTGVVYHTNYLKYMERARSDWAFSVGFGEEELAGLRMGFAVKTAEIDYCAPARLTDHLRVETYSLEVRRSAFRLLQKVKLAETDQLLCEGNILIVAVNDRFRPTAVPAALLAHLKGEVVHD